jgi:hypothetical protein
MDIGAAAGVVGLPIVAADGLAAVAGAVVAGCANASDAKVELTASITKNFFTLVSGVHGMTCLQQ